MGKIGRNDPCPCGSGKKYKKCCLLTERKIGKKNRSTDFLAFAIDWILDEPKLESEFEQVLRKYSHGKEANEFQFRHLLNAFVFDYKLPRKNKTPFQYFLERAELSPHHRQIGEGFENNVFSIFEILDVQYDKGLWLRDMIWNKKYWVEEILGTHSTNPGEVVLCRVAPFKDVFISLSPFVYRWPSEATYMLERGFRGLRSQMQDKPLNAFDIFEIIHKKQDEPKDLPEIKKVLKKKLNKIGLKIDFRGLNKRINEHTHINDAFPEIVEFPFPSNKDFEETMYLFLQLWNAHPRKEFKAESPEQVSKIGPKENMLIQDLMNETQKNVNPNSYSTLKEAQDAVEKFRAKWLKTPQKELKGRTPLDVILKERELIGNPNKTFDIRMEITNHPDYDINLAEKLYFEGIDAFKEGALGKAAECFDQVTKMYPENYKAWANLGVSVAYLGGKKEAIRYFKKALSINPKYEFARKKYEEIEKLDEKTLGMFGIAGAFTGLRYYGIGKHRKEPREKIDVWVELDKALKEERKKKED